MISRRRRTTRRGGGARGGRVRVGACAAAGLLLVVRPCRPGRERRRASPGRSAGATGARRPRLDLAGSAPQCRRAGARRGLWIALVLLAVLGAGAGAATILLLRHNTGHAVRAGQHRHGGRQSSGLDGRAPGRPRCRSSTRSTARRARSRPGGPRSRTRLPAGEAAGFSRRRARHMDAVHHRLPDLPAGPVGEREHPASTSRRTPSRTTCCRKRSTSRASRWPRTASPGTASSGWPRRRSAARDGSYWKFTWQDNGVEQEAIDLLFVLQTPAGAQSYALYMTAPASMWTQMRPTFDEVAETFAPQT